MLKQLFISLTQNYTSNTALVEQLWMEIYTSYSNKKRYYHTVTHLESLIKELSQCRQMIEDWEIILFSVFYHDIIYNVLKKDNEEKSALLAEKRLKSISLPLKRIENCTKQIRATKKHEYTNQPDTDLFTDADLSILGVEPDLYKNYSDQIRKEYAIYPDPIYKAGRKKVLNYFLQLNRLYKTEVFFNKYEERARHNLQEELNACT